MYTIACRRADLRLGAPQISDEASPLDSASRSDQPAPPGRFSMHHGFPALACDEFAHVRLKPSPLRELNFIHAKINLLDCYFDYVLEQISKLFLELDPASQEHFLFG
jgi:hypothetical protein